MSQQRETVSWLFVVTVVSAGLFFLQLVMGNLAHCDVLLADSGHAGTDVITYLVSFVLESRKVSGEWALSTEGRRKADLVGCAVSAGLLVMTTVYASRESLSRLTSASKGDFSNIGVTLVVFSVLSTLMNLGLLVAHSLGVFDFQNGWDIGLPWVEPRPPSDDDAEYEEFLSPTRRQPANVFHQARQSPDERRKKRRGLNLVGAYNESKVCTDPNNCSDNNCADGCNNSNDSFSLGAKLHHLVHPNCGSSHGFTGADQNLNVLSTLLHLFTDVARSVTIFVVGLLIQVGVIKQPGQADAICALAVAALVVLGSFSLLWQVAAEVWKTTAQYKPLFGGIQLAEPEDLEAGLANLGLPASSSQQYL